jgi:uncharacterized membrane protein YvbJ
MNFCSGCGVKISNNPKFCPQCGQPVSGASKKNQSSEGTLETKPPLSDLLLRGKTKGQSSNQVVLWWIIRIAAAAAFIAFVATRK